MTYKPNFKYASTRNRAQHVIAWLETYVGAEPNRTLLSTVLRSPSAFGDSPLGRYLRNYVLIKTNPSYEPGVRSQQYRINPDRLNKLRQLVGLEPTELRFLNILRRFDEQAEALATGQFDYNETGGRAYNGLQNIAKDIKQQEFARRGFAYDYDIECCAPTLFLQRARQIKPKMPVLTTITEYIENKTQVRDELAIKYNLSSRQVKQVLNGLFQGGILNTYYTNKIFGYLNHNTTKLTQLKQDQFIVLLQQDIRYMWKILRDDIKLTLNCDFKRCLGRHKSAYYKELEGQVMKPVCKYMKKNKVKFFREHDGFRTQSFVVPNDLEQIVNKTTGYHVKFIWSKIEVNDSNVVRGLDI